MRRSLAARALAALVAGTCLFAVAAQAADDAAKDTAKAGAGAYNATGRRLGGGVAQSPDANANILLSPYSVGSAMAMALSGARGATEQEMAATLKLTMPGAEMREANAALIAALNKLGAAEGKAPIKLNVANA